MHPDDARTVYGQRREELAAGIRGGRLGRRRESRRWKVSWTMLSPRDVPGAASHLRSWTIIISASRPG